MTKLLQSLRIKNIVKLLLISSVVLAVISLFNLVRFYYQSESQVKKHAKEITQTSAVTIENRLKEIESIINKLAEKSTKQTIPDALMKVTLKDALLSNDALFGIVIAYAPYQYLSTERLHSLYATHKNLNIDFSSVEETYDYTNNENEWFNRPLQVGAFWSKPFWGKASKAMVVTYSVPVYRQKNDGEKHHLATISAVCSLSNLNNIIASLDLGSSGYGFLLDKDGTFIAHPSEQLALDKVTITEYASKHYSKANQQIINKGIRDFFPFLYQEPTKLTKQMGVITLEPIKSIGWFAGSALVKAEIDYSSHDEERQLFYCIALLIYFICCFVLYQLVGDELENNFRKFPISAATLTITFTTGLIAIWGIEMSMGFPSPYEDTGFISDKRSITNFIQKRTQTSIEQHKQPPKFISTGILVNSLKFVGLNNVEISGTIWQKIPNQTVVDNDMDNLGGFSLPTASKISVKKAFHAQEGGSTVTAKHFSAEIQQNFNNTLYPFDRLQVKIPIRQLNMLDNVQLVPDFSSYPVYVPSANPFMVKDLSIPRWQVKQTYFLLEKQEYPTTFGFADKSMTANAHDLVLILTLQREILASIISTFLPLFMLALIMYKALLLSSNDERKVNVFWFRPANMQVVAGSFLLYLVFSTINIRNDMLSDGILYVEYIFFLMYFVIFGLIIASLKITLKDENSIFGYRDGYIPKLMYWPLVSGSMFLITALVFF